MKSTSVFVDFHTHHPQVRTCFESLSQLRQRSHFTRSRPEKLASCPWDLLMDFSLLWHCSECYDGFHLRNQCWWSRDCHGLRHSSYSPWHYYFYSLTSMPPTPHASPSLTVDYYQAQPPAAHYSSLWLLLPLSRDLSHTQPNLCPISDFNGDGYGVDALLKVKLC